jgi:hypothetical protein
MERSLRKRIGNDPIVYRQSKVSYLFMVHWHFLWKVGFEEALAVLQHVVLNIFRTVKLVEVSK